MFDNTFKAERLWTIARLAEALNVPKSWIYDQTYRRKIPFRKIGGKLRFDPVEIDVWIESLPGWSLKKSSGNLASPKRKD